MELQRLIETIAEWKPLYHLHAGDKFQIRGSTCYGQIEQIVLDWDGHCRTIRRVGDARPHGSILLVYQAHFADGRLIHGSKEQPIQMVEPFYKMVQQIK